MSLTRSVVCVSLVVCWRWRLAGPTGARVLRLLRRGQRREADQQRVAGRADAQGQPHGHDDVQQLPGPARELRDGGAGAGGAAEGERQDAARRRVRPRRLAVGAAAGRVLGAGPLPAADAAAHALRRRAAVRTSAGGARKGRGRTWASRSRRASSTGEYEVVILSAQGLVGPRDLAAPGEIQHPAGRGGGAGALHPRQVEVLRRQGRHQEGEARRAGRRAAVAAALLLRRQRAAPAGAPRACSTPAASRT